MKKLIALASIAALAACAEAEAPAVEEAAEEVAAPAPVAAGTYEVTYADGSVGTMVSEDDGTFSMTIGETTGTGTYVDQDGKVCFDADGDDEGATCWTNSPAGEDGSFTSVSDDGDTVSVAPVAEEADAEG